MSTADTTMENALATVTTEVREHRGWFLLLGIALVLLGIAALTFPFVSTLAAELLVGSVLTISGALSLVHAFRAARWKGFLLSLLGALLSLAVGILLLVYPMTGILSLTLVVGAFFLAGGTLRVMLALRLRPVDHWGWLLASGLLALALGVLILLQWPQAAVWVIGVLVGIDLIFAGWSSIFLSMAARHAS
jgi:uncharacterized membrane protein HdeD (DUF308 family)